MEERQDTFNSTTTREVKYGNYYPCYVREVSPDRTRLVIEFGKWCWEVPASSVLIVVKND